MLRRVIVFTGVIVTLMSTLPVEAGRWVVIMLDSLPAEIRAGELISISFMVRQHGQTLIHSVNPVLSATNTGNGQTMTAEAKKDADLGRYTVVGD